MTQTHQNLFTFYAKLRSKSYLIKAFPPKPINYPASVWYRPGYVYEMMITELDLVLHLTVHFGRD